MTLTRLAAAVVALALGVGIVNAQAIRPRGGTDVDAPAEAKAPTPANDAALAKLLKDAPLLLRATIDKVTAVATTNSIPPSFLFEVTIKDVKMLRGEKPAATKLSYVTNGQGNPASKAGAEVIIAAKANNEYLDIIAITEATDENLKAVGAAGATSTTTSSPAGTASEPSSAPAGAVTVHDQALFDKLALSPVLFVAKIKDVQMGAVGRVEPPIFHMRFALGDFRMLRGAEPKNAVFNRTISQAVEPKYAVGSSMVVGATIIENAAQVSAMVDATDDNTADAVLAGSLPIGWSVSDGRILCPWAAGSAQVRFKALVGIFCSKTGRPALFAGKDVTMSVEKIIPKDAEKLVNPLGDGEFKVTVANNSTREITVPALMNDGRGSIRWTDSLVILDYGGSAHVLPATQMYHSVGTRLAPGESVSTTINTLALKGIAWPDHPAPMVFTFALGEVSATDSFWYNPGHHGKLRAEALKAINSPSPMQPAK